MKKLLLLVLLATTLIQAEEFNLVCEGEMIYLADNQADSKFSKTIGVKVREESIKIDKYTFYTRIIDSLSSYLAVEYIKDNNLITVTKTSKIAPNKKHCSIIDYTANINRVNGAMKTEWRQTDKCMSKEYFFHAIFEGKCKMQRKKFLLN